MPDNRVRILIIEDEAILSMDLCDTLEAKGYSIVGTASNGRRALELFQTNAVDLVICDIHIKGDWDGIETITHLLGIRIVPVIYLTALTDKATLGRALATLPAAYLTKPVTIAGLQASIELAIYKMAQLLAPAASAEAAAMPLTVAPASTKETISRETILQFGDNVFLKHDYRFVRITLRDIVLLEADNTYTTLITSSRRYALRLTLNSVMERLQRIKGMVRIHRSYAVNMQHIEMFSDHEMTVAGQVVPIGQHYKKAFLQQFSLW